MNNFMIMIGGERSFQPFFITQVTFFLDASPL